MYVCMNECTCACMYIYVYVEGGDRSMRYLALSSAHTEHLLVDLGSVVEALLTSAGNRPRDFVGTPGTDTGDLCVVMMLTSIRQG